VSRLHLPMREGTRVFHKLASQLPAGNNEAIQVLVKRLEELKRQQHVAQA
jgi:hypothetical protein